MIRYTPPPPLPSFFDRSFMFAALGLWNNFDIDIRWVLFDSVKTSRLKTCALTPLVSTINRFEVVNKHYI